MLATLFPKSKRQSGSSASVWFKGVDPSSPPSMTVRVRAVRRGSGHFRSICPVLDLVQPHADGLKGRPAVKAVGRVGREQEAAVSGYGSPQKAPEGHAALQPGLLAGEVPEALLYAPVTSSRHG